VTESEASLKAALSLLARLPGAVIHEGPDISWLASGRPLASLNHVHGIHLGGDAAGDDARIDQTHAAVTQGGALPATWWIGPTTAPVDIGARLADRGYQEAEPEFGMVAEVAGLPTPDGEIEDVGARNLGEWLGVMGRAYGWSDPRAIGAWTELYQGALHDRTPPWWHVLVRDGGVAVACASLFPAGNLGFVTNVGTVPEARGAGHGTAATLAVLAIAQQQGFRRASLTASLMGRSVYARIGFREDARLDRYVSVGS
jgi:ribosomal protein S18 acetylase RimI-like enzyme